MRQYTAYIRLRNQFKLDLFSQVCPCPDLVTNSMGFEPSPFLCRADRCATMEAKKDFLANKSAHIRTVRYL